MTKLSSNKIEEVTDNIISGLFKDILDRHTIKHVWRAIDEDIINKELIPEWRKIITEQIKELIK